MHKFLPTMFIFLDKYNSQVFKNNSTNIGIIYRNYNSKKREIELIKIAKACKKTNYKLYVSNNFKLALRVKSDGVYIPSYNNKRIYNNLVNKNLVILGSAHNQKEIIEKKNQNCHAVFLSPIFHIKKKNKHLGVCKFNLLSLNSKIKLFALGGINEKNVNKLRILNSKGFGAISLFKKKPAFKRPVL